MNFAPPTGLPHLFNSAALNENGRLSTPVFVAGQQAQRMAPIGVCPQRLTVRLDLNRDSIDTMASANQIHPNATA